MQWSGLYNSREWRCEMCPKPKEYSAEAIVKYEQNDEKIPNSKIYKVFAKNVIEKRKENHYTYKCERIQVPAQKILLWRKHK